jgi:hypothetical protein
MNNLYCIKQVVSAQQKKQSSDSRDSLQYGRKSLPGTHPQRINTPKKWAHELNRECLKEEFQMASKYMRKCSTSLYKRDANQNKN